jgi:hypothetical protein
MYRKILFTAAATSLLGLSACDQIDPLEREGVWHPMHVNRADLTMQAAYPADLVRGSGVHSNDGQLAAAAVQRLHENKVKKLIDSGLSDISVQSQGSSGN